MLDFLKRLGKALYDATIGGVVRLVRNARAGKVDGRDKATVGRLLTYAAYVVFAICFPVLAAFVALFRMLTVLDIIHTVADVFQSTANSYAD